MAQRGYEDDDDDAPWLREAAGPRVERTTVTRRSMFWTIVGLLLLATIAVVGTVVLLARKESGSTAGYMNAEQAPLIEAVPGPYKVKPGDPQGLDVDGEGQTIYATGEGVDPGGTIDPDAGPEEPLTRPGSLPVAPGGMSTAGPPRDLLPDATGTVAGAVIKPTPAAPPVFVPPALKPAAPPAIAKSPALSTPDADGRIKAVVPKPVTSKPAEDKPVEPRPAGKAAAQLGAFKTEAAANAAWAAQAGSLGGYAKRVEAVETAGGTLYRLRATGGDGAALCAKLSAKGAACKVID